MIALPQYLDPEAWAGFEEMRRTLKKPMTDRARKLIIAELHKIKTAGHCPNAALDQSTNHCWADVYVPKEKPIEASSASEADKTAAYLAEQREHAERAKQARGIRRVA
jgi:hypothetical protein